MGRLTTHVLDTSAGRPAAGVAVAVERLEANGARVRVAEARTNQDGRCDAPLLEGADFAPGVYELAFEAGAYFAAAAAPPAGDPPFLGTVVIRVGLSERGGHYHVPLLLSPFGYSTYRGS